MNARQYTTVTHVVHAIHLMPEYSRDIMLWFSGMGYDAMPCPDGVVITEPNGTSRIVPWKHYFLIDTNGTSTHMDPFTFAQQYREA